MIIQKPTCNVIRSFALLAVLSLPIAACTDEAPGNWSKGGALCARKISQKEISRSVPPNDYFDEKTQYRFWVYGKEQGETGTDPNLLSDPNTGEESGTHYITFTNEKNDARIQGDIHIYGFTNNTSKEAPEFANPDERKFRIRLNEPGGSKEEPNRGYYYDYCRGYRHYNSEEAEFAAASSVVVPFRHILSQLTVTVLQQGEVVLIENPDGTTHREIKGRYDIKLKKMRLCNSITQADYDVCSDKFDLDENYRQVDRYIWIWDGDEVGKPIPYQEEREGKEDAAPETSVLVLPQQPERGQAFNLKLRVSGKDAIQFVNDNNEGSYQEEGTGDVIITLPFVDNTEPEKEEPIAFQSGYHYNLVVVFQGADVNIVTLRPTIYPFFEGETKEGNFGDRYENQSAGQSHVFDDVEWSDRYMGASEYHPVDKSSFVAATGFYYQKDRTIPFFPSTYVGGKVVDQDGKVIGDIDDEGIATGKLEEGKVYYHLYGHWKDVEEEAMWNNPKVKPVVSYYLSPEQALSYNPPDKKFSTERYRRDKFIYDKDQITEWKANWWDQSTGAYCTTVDEFTQNGGYWEYSGNVNVDNTAAGGHLCYPSPKQFIRFVASMENTPSYTWKNTSNLPCPPGWRLPTRNEFYSIMPSSPFAGNICFLNHYGVADGTVGGNYAEVYKYKELYVKLPYTSEADCNLKVPDGVAATDDFREWNEKSKAIFFPGISATFGDPSPKYSTEYVIGIRRFTAEEYGELTPEEKEKVGSQDEYTEYAPKVKDVIDQTLKAVSDINGSNVKRFIPWGGIYAIKKVGTPDAYRMRWRVERIPAAGDTYQLVVERYKSNANEHLLYELKDIHDPHFYMNYDWEHPDVTLYFPITGMVGDREWVDWWPSAAGAIYNYGTETILLTSDYEEYGDNMYQATYRIKVAGGSTTCQYLYPAMDRLANGGQVRPVRTAK